MEQPHATRFDDLLLDAVEAIQTMIRRGTGWGGAAPEEKGRAIELERGLAGERRFAKQAEDPELLGCLEDLAASGGAQLRMLEGLTAPRDEELAVRFERDAHAYRAVVARSRSAK